MQSFTPQPTPQPAPTTPINAPAETSSEFAPMPLRARGVLEQLDLAVKVYRRYFATLTSWSALVMGACTVIGLFGLVLMGPSFSRAMTASGGASPSAIMAPMMGVMSLFALAGIVGFFGYPLVIGAVACSVTAAVRGQRIEFEQCWAFVKPRYGGMLLQIFLGILAAGLIGFVAMLGLGIVFAIVVGLGAFLANSLGSAGVLFLILGVIAGIAFYIFLIIIGSGFYMWIMMIPIVAAMEDNRRSGGAIARAWELMRQGWKRAAGLIVLSSIGISILSWIFQIIALALVGGSFFSTTNSTAESAVTFLSSMLISIFSIPISILIASLFYLDQRVRHEALDLEWASYASSENAPAAAIAPAIEYSNASFGAPQTNSYAPTSATNNYSPTPTSPRTYASADNNPFDASTEDLASMSLDDLMPKKKPTSDETARAQAETVAALDLPQVPNLGATPYASNQNQTQVFPQDAAFSPDNFAGDSTSRTRSHDELVTAPQNQSPVQSASKTCAQCGAQVAPAQNFCLTCGARL